jgi:hypothetical protein
MKLHNLAYGVALATLAGAGVALAQAPAAPAAPMPMAMSTPSMTGPLSANPNPANFDAGPLGKVYVTGAVTGLAFTQDHQVPGDKSSRADLSNAQVIVQKTDGVLQYYVQAGTYSLISLGAPYVKSSQIGDLTYNVVPVAYAKLAPTAEFSIEAGKLPTLIGAEYTFSYENPNITRGLLWNQETAISRGVQANYAKGPLTVSVSWNDGFYSNKYTWGSALISYAINSENTLALVGGGNFSHEPVSTFATPLAQNNGQIYNVIWTHTAGPFLFIPYFQYTYVPAIPSLGILNSASTTGFAVLGKYSITPEFSIAARGEYISASSGGTTNLLYGPGSSAWSLTVTPTYQVKTFFVRGELAYTEADSITRGFGFGKTGLEKSQTRGLIETGVVF